MQDRMLPVSFGYFLMQKMLGSCPGLQIFHQQKTSGQWMPSDSLVTLCLSRLSINWHLLELGCRFQGQLSACGTWAYRGNVLHGCFFKGSYPVFRRVSEKATGKLQTARSISATGDWTWRLPSTSFESQTASPLVALFVMQIVMASKHFFFTLRFL